MISSFTSSNFNTEMILKSKKTLYYSFLLALTPVFFEWFHIGSPEMRPPCRGIYILRGSFYFAIALYYIMLFLKKRRGIIVAHLLVVVSYLVAFHQFPVRMNVMSTPNWEYTMQKVNSIFWLAILTVLLHLILVISLLRKDNKHGK